MSLPTREAMIAHLVLNDWAPVSSTHWEIGVVNRETGVLLLATDGMLHRYERLRIAHWDLPWADLDDATVMAVYMLLNAGVKDG